MKRAVFFDIDGTLAIRRDIPASAQRALKTLQKNDTGVFICTGRSAAYVRAFFSPYADGFICANGRYAFLGTSVLYDHPIEPDHLSLILRAAYRYDCGIVCFGNGCGYYFGNPGGLDLFSASYPDDILRMKETDMIHEPVYTFDAFFPSDDARYALSSELKDICLFNPHGPFPTADATVFGHDKGTALSAVIKALGIPREDTYAFGDGMNDLCMFAAAGHGIAMGNALEEVKDAAEFVTTGILNDGVYNGLARYGLI